MNEENLINAVEIGLYRHFKGNYYFVYSVGFLVDKELCVQYFRLLEPEKGSFIRPVSDFIATSCVYKGKTISISERPDNVTGQSIRFERITKL